MKKMKAWSILGGVAAVLLLTAAMLFFIFTGPQDLSQFPPPEESPYLLPWPEGIEYFCVQGVRGVVSHRGDSQFAYDFHAVGFGYLRRPRWKSSEVVQHYDGSE